MSRRAVLSRKFGKRVIRPADIPEFSALSEVRYTLEAGRVVEQPAYGRTLDQIVLSITAVSELFKIRLRVDRGDKAWSNAQSALQVRDRITHPKSSQTFQVVDRDVKAVEAFHNWFTAQLFIMGNTELVAMIKRESAIAKRTKKTRRLTIEVSKGGWKSVPNR